MTAICRDLLEVDLIARTIYGEARGEPEVGKMAIAWVIRNRVETDLHGDGKPDWWGEGVTEVIHKPYQFSCWNAGDPNSAKIANLSIREPRYMECLAAAARVMANQTADPTSGATHYHTVGLRPVPSWAVGKPAVATIGNHIFYKNIG